MLIKYKMVYVDNIIVDMIETQYCDVLINGVNFCFNNKFTLY
jgi:hypothetical protein